MSSDSEDENDKKKSGKYLYASKTGCCWPLGTKIKLVTKFD